MVQEIKNMVLYSGTDRQNYERVKPNIQKANRIMTTVLSSFATILIFAMLVISCKSNSIENNRIVYQLGLIMSIIVLIASVTIARKYDWVIMLLVYCSYSIYYLYGILIGAITDPTGKTVTFMVMLVFMPTLFIDRPLHVFMVTSIYIAIFIVLCLKYKTGAVLSIDVMDAIIFGILGVSSGCVINHMKIRGYVSDYNLKASESQLKEISRIDQLTQMNNQNAFKLDMHKISDIYKNSIACVYIDVNGLHQLNNEKGHDAGDTMLRFIAKQVQEYFGYELSYRAGGDEFVAFVLDVKREELVNTITNFIDSIEKAEYSVSLGYEFSSTRCRTITKLVQNAELRMREEKKIYHSLYGGR